jgi:hypothetical protein
MLPELPRRGIHGVHAFSCALPTRGGTCDCQPDTPGDPADPYRTCPAPPEADPTSSGRSAAGDVAAATPAAA